MPNNDSSHPVPHADALSALLTRQEIAWKAGELLAIEHLANELPKDDSGDDHLLLLICNEISLRQAAGEQPELTEYQQRFPHLAGPLRVQWTVDLFLGNHSRISNEDKLTATLPGKNDSTARELPTQQSTQSTLCSDDSTPTVLDSRYELQQVIGRGGMGIVYRARDQRLDRMVAIKMLRSVNHRKQLASTIYGRFYQEAEALAKLDHPNIIPIYDVGRDVEHPYLVMEYCPKGSLAEYLKGNPLEARRAAKLVQLIASGVSIAHEKGIVHRDLKPSNILLAGPFRTSHPSAMPTPSSVSLLPQSSPDTRPEFDSLTPRITDFGLAKILNESESSSSQPLTESGDFLGTPSYMAPEQLSATQLLHPQLADIYSLGAILYECLVGRPPIRGATFLETLELVRSQEPVAARKLQPRLSVDLSTIVDKCLQREPTHRYHSANELATDLQRFLDGRPVLAKPSPWYRRAGKWTRRHPTASVSLALMTAAFLAAITGWGVFTKQLKVAQDKAELERDAAKFQAERAERNAGLAMEAVDKLISQVGDQRLAATPQVDQVRKELLQTAVEFCLRIAADQDSTDPAARNEAALAYRRLAKIHRALGEKADWLASLESAATIHRQLISEYPENLEFMSEFGRTLNNLANISPKRLEVLEEALAIKMELVTREPQSAEYRSSLALSLANIGKDYRIQDPDKAEQAYRQAEELISGLVDEFPTELTYRETAFTLYQNWTAGNIFAGKFAAAQRTAAAQRRLVESDPRGITHPDVRSKLASSLESLAITQLYALERSNALQTFESQLVLIEQSITDYPERVALKVDALRCHFNIVNVLRDLADFESVEGRGLAVIEQADKWLADYPDDFNLQRYATQIRLANAQTALEQEKFADVLAWNEKVAPFCDPLLDGDGLDPVLVCVANNHRVHQALAKYYLGEKEQAITTMRACNQRMRTILKTQPTFVEAQRLFLLSTANLILMSVRNGSAKEALQFTEELIATHPGTEPWTGQLLLALSKAALGDYRPAIEVLKTTKGSEVQSTMWPDRITIATACYAIQAVQNDSAITSEEREKTCKELLEIAQRELQAAEAEAFFRAPICQNTLTTFPEYGVLIGPIVDEITR